MRSKGRSVATEPNRFIKTIEGHGSAMYQMLLARTSRQARKQAAPGPKRSRPKAKKKTRAARRFEGMVNSKLGALKTSSEDGPTSAAEKRRSEAELPTVGQRMFPVILCRWRLHSVGCCFVSYNNDTCQSFKQLRTASYSL